MKQAISNSTHSLTHSLTHLVTILIILLFFSCKEQPVQPEPGAIQNDANNQALAMLSKSGDIDKKEKVKKLREEHEKPYYSIKKPIDALKEYLENRKNTSVVKAAKTNTVMSSNCNPLYVEHWVLEKYLPVSGKTIGIHPIGSRENGTIKLCQYEQSMIDK